MPQNYWLLLVAGLIPLLVGFIWYNPKVFGNEWMKTIGMTEESMKGGNMALIFGLCYVFACILAMGLMPIVIHQFGALSLTGGDATKAKPSYQAFLNDYETVFRTFKHGALHGGLTALFIALPVFGTNALFERRSVKYVAIHVGYWFITMLLMGGVLCAFL